MTSAEAIKAAILAAMSDKPHLNAAQAPALREFVEAIAQGVYQELRKLDDEAGDPPSVGHR